VNFTTKVMPKGPLKLGMSVIVILNHFLFIKGERIFS